MVKEMSNQAQIRKSLNEAFASDLGKFSGGAGRPIVVPERTAKVNVKINLEVKGALNYIQAIASAVSSQSGSTVIHSSVLADHLHSDPDIRAETLRLLRIPEADFLREWKSVPKATREPELGKDYFRRDVRVLLAALIQETPWLYLEPSRLWDMPGRMGRSDHGVPLSDIIVLDPYTRVALYSVAAQRTTIIESILGSYPKVGRSAKYSYAVSDCLHDALVRAPDLERVLREQQPEMDVRMVYSSTKTWVDAEPKR